jgi:hypothetical protein
MKPLDFLIGTSSLSLVFFFLNCTISFGLGKVPKSILKNYVRFLRVGNEFSYENKIHWQKQIYYNVHHINIEGWEKINNYLQKQFIHFEIIEIYFSNCQKLKVQFKYLQVHWKYIIYQFKMPKIFLKECTQKNWYYFHKFIYLLYLLLETPKFCIVELLFSITLSCVHP